MEEALSIEEQIQRIMSRQKWDDVDKNFAVGNIRRRKTWVDLMSHFEVQMSPEEKAAWEKDAEIYKSNPVGIFLQYLSTWQTPDQKTMRYKWNNLNRGMTQTGFVQDPNANIRHFEDWGDRKFALEYIQYLRILHNYLRKI